MHVTVRLNLAHATLMMHLRIVDVDDPRHSDLKQDPQTVAVAVAVSNTNNEQ